MKIEKIINCIKIMAVLLLFSAFDAHAQAIAQDVLDEVTIKRNGYTGIIKVKFRIPLRYISHNPEQTGNEVRIKVDFLNPNARNAVKSGEANLRESIVPRYKYSFGLEEVSYETVLRDNYITLYFEKEVSFEIIQDPDYRSISIIVHDLK